MAYKASWVKIPKNYTITEKQFKEKKVIINEKSYKIFKDAKGREYINADIVSTNSNSKVFNLI